MIEALTLPAELRDRLLELALATPALEVCALLGGPPGGGRATRVVPIRNVAGEAGHEAVAAGLGLAGRGPAAEYLMDPQETIRCFEAFRREGLAEVAVFHSHPRGPAAPSATDVRLALYPHCAYLVCAPAAPVGPSLRAFRIAAGRADEIPLVVAGPREAGAGSCRRDRPAVPRASTPRGEHDPMLTVLDAKYGRLQRLLAEGGPTLVCYSGGADSALLLRIARDVLGDAAVALTAASPSLADEERREAARLAAAIGARQIEVETREMEDPGYVANSPRRCYFCKSALFREAARVARRLGLATIVYGANADDALDFRPGMQAARELGIGSPLLDAGLTKAEVRALSRRLGLPTADKPAQPCLASRLPYGTAVTLERLRTIDRGESALRRLGFRDLRVRHHGDLARIEVPAADLPRLLAPDTRGAVLAALRDAGFRHVTVDLAGLRSGSLNEGITAAV